VSRISRRWARAKRRVRRWVEGPIHARPELGLEKIGSDYGGWIVPTALVRETWRCYNGGVGEDVTFDLGLIERFGCDVFAFDPTPRAIAYAEPIAAREPRFHFLPVGLWSTETVMKFWAPRDPTHVSHSALNLQRTSEWFEAPCRSVSSLMTELGHDAIDLLKIDIEGAEHTVLASTLAAGVRPTVLCFEIDQPVAPLRFWRTLRMIRAHGYSLVAVDGWNYTFLRAA
jgi:FkbM family methyltransferase